MMILLMIGSLSLTMKTEIKGIEAEEGDAEEEEVETEKEGIEGKIISSDEY